MRLEANLGRRDAWLILYSATILAVGSQATSAGDRFGDSLDQDRAYSARRQGDVVPLNSMMSAARAQGKVLDVQLKGGKYRFKSLDENGRIRYVDGDALSASKRSEGGGPGRVGDDRGIGSTGGSSGPGGGPGSGSTEGSGSHESSSGRGRSGGR